MQNPTHNHSLKKVKIKFLLLQGIHPRAKYLENSGYANIFKQAGALTPKDLHKALKGVHFIGIRTRIPH